MLMKYIVLNKFGELKVVKNPKLMQAYNLKIRTSKNKIFKKEILIILLSFFSF